MKNRELTVRVLAGVLAGAAVYGVPADCMAGEVVISSDADLSLLSSYARKGIYHLKNGDNTLIIDGQLSNERWFSGGLNNNGYGVNMKNGSVYGLTGAFSEGGDAENNAVEISGGYVVWKACGGDCDYDNAMGTGSARNNRVDMSGGIAGIVCGACGNVLVQKNKVNISSDAIVRFEVYGGESRNGRCEENEVNISGGTVGTVYGALSNGSVTDNTVNISGGRVTGDVYGGKSRYGSSEVHDNKVNLSGGTVEGTIYGSSLASDNAAATGNTLNVKAQNLTAGNIANFNKINFFIPNTAADGSTLLTLTGNGDTDISNAAVRAGVTIQGNANLAKGDRVNLLVKSGTGEIKDTNTGYGTLTVSEGVSADYTLSIAKSGDAKSLVATVKSPPTALKEQTKSLAEAQAAGMALVNGGMDMLAEQGIVRAVQAGSTGVGTAQPFAAAGAAGMKYQTGSYVDMKGWHIVMGVARTLENSRGRLTFGPLVSYGTGSYDSYLDDGVHGSGSGRYTGIGMLARQDMTDGSYYEGSISGGRLSLDYGSENMKAAAYTAYDNSTHYAAVNIGGGKINRLDAARSLEVYGKYFFAYQGSSEATLNTGETYRFASISSHRMRVGARYSCEYSPAHTAYWGAAYEYELGGTARASYKGMDTPSPSLRGGSGMVEVGWQSRPGRQSPLTVDLSLKGWAGKKQGWSVNADLSWAF
ncbi:MAG: hypothetical protein PHQ44_05200 [Anaerovibrio sp.]|nr:hypothetical protein [Anaerovibrio sp.]